MNWDQIAGNWKQLQGKFRQKWGKLTGSDLEQVAGQRKRLVGLLQERYGIAKEKAQEQLDEFIASLEAESEEETETVETAAGHPRV